MLANKTKERARRTKLVFIMMIVQMDWKAVLLKRDCREKLILYPRHSDKKPIIIGFKVVTVAWQQMAGTGYL